MTRPELGTNGGGPSVARRAVGLTSAPVKVETRETICEELIPECTNAHSRGGAPCQTSIKKSVIVQWVRRSLPSSVMAR